jgi:hypothetical protein
MKSLLNIFVGDDDKEVVDWRRLNAEIDIGS